MRYRRRRTADAKVDALLRDVTNLRLTLNTDLTLAAAAAEEDRFDVAAEIVDIDRAELAAFVHTAASKLQPPEQSAEAPARRRPEKLAWRHRFALAAAPAMLTAAAVIAVVGMSGGTTPRATSQPRLVASYSALTELVKSNEDPAALLAVGRELNQSLAQLIAAAPNDPAKARQALRILMAEEILLRAHNPSGGAALLAQAQALVRRLRQTVPLSVLEQAAPVTRPSPPLAITLLPSTSRPEPQPTHTTPGAPTPAPTPPSQSPAPAPSSGDATVPPQPSPNPSFTDPWPFGENGFGDSGS
ncbi:MAG: hypothetical protein ACJ735_00425 [Actinomycetes bacterium]